MQEQDLTDDLPDFPNTVHSHEQLITLLREGLNSPVREFTDETLEQMRQEVRKRQNQYRF